MAACSISACASGHVHLLASLPAHTTDWVNHSTRWLLPKQMSWKAWRGLGLLHWEGETTKQWIEKVRTPSLLSFVLSERAYLYMIVCFYVALSFHMCSESTCVNGGPSSSTTITGVILHCWQRCYTGFKLKNETDSEFKEVVPILRSPNGYVTL